MFGNKWKYFCLICRFIGWFLLGVVTLGVGFLWIMPYMMASLSRFYLDIRDLPAAPASAWSDPNYSLDDE
jgi:uncharacterized membrane protein